jgi:hypothetical protein
MAYRPPTGEELRELLKRWCLTGAAAGALVDVDGRTVRRWTGDERPIPFAALYTLAHRAAGVPVVPESWRSDLGMPGPEIPR